MAIVQIPFLFVPHASNASSITKEWKALSPKVQECFRIAARGSNNSLEALIANGIRPSDPRLSDVMKTCQRYADGMRQRFDCDLKDQSGNTIHTLCREYYVVQRGGEWQEIQPTAALEAWFIDHETVMTMNSELPEGLAKRQQAISQELGANPNSGSPAASTTVTDSPTEDANVDSAQQQNTEYEKKLKLDEQARLAAAEKWKNDWADKQRAQSSSSVNEEGNAKASPSSMNQSNEQSPVSTTPPVQDTSTSGVSDTAALNTGVQYYENNDYSTALKYLLPLADKGSPKAQFYVGWANYHGQGMEKNYPAALHWITLAAEGGYPQAENMLGNIYEWGNLDAKIVSDVKSAQSWYRSAIAHGDCKALNNLLALEKDLRRKGREKEILTSSPTQTSVADCVVDVDVGPYSHLINGKKNRSLTKEYGCFDRQGGGRGPILSRYLAEALLKDDGSWPILMTTSPYREMCFPLYGAHMDEQEFKFGVPEVVGSRSLSGSGQQEVIVFDNFSQPGLSMGVILNYSR